MTCLRRVGGHREQLLEQFAREVPLRDFRGPQTPSSCGRSKPFERGWSIKFVPSHNQADRTFNNDPVIERIVKLLNERPLSLRGDCGLKKLLDDDFEGTD